jgi:hypothetical protein
VAPEQAYARKLWAEPGNEAAVELNGPGTLRVKALPGHRLILVGIAAPTAAEQDRAAKALPEWVEGGLPDAVLDFGLVRQETKHIAPGLAPGVSCEDVAIQIGMWQLPDRVMLVVHNSDGEAARTAQLKVDLDALGLAPELEWQEVVGVRQLYAEDQAPAPEGMVTLKGIPPRGGRLVAIRKY